MDGGKRQLPLFCPDQDAGDELIGKCILIPIRVNHAA
jgi:hypothetical protein